MQIVQLERDSTQIAQDLCSEVDLTLVRDSLLTIRQIVIDCNLIKEFKEHSLEHKIHNKNKIRLCDVEDVDVLIAHKSNQIVKKSKKFRETKHNKSP